MALVHVCIFAFALPMIFAVQEASVQGTQAHEQHSVSPSGKLLAAGGSLMHSADVADGSALMRRHAAQPSVGTEEDHTFTQPSALSDGFQGTMRSLQSQIAAGSALEIGETMRKHSSAVHQGDGGFEEKFHAADADKDGFLSLEEAGHLVSAAMGLPEGHMLAQRDASSVDFKAVAQRESPLPSSGTSAYLQTAQAPSDTTSGASFTKHAGKHCSGVGVNLPGFVRGSAVSSNGVALNANEEVKTCEAICAQYDNCKGFIYRTSDRKCFWQNTGIAPYSFSGHDCYVKTVAVTVSNPGR